MNETLKSAISVDKDNSSFDGALTGLLTCYLLPLKLVIKVSAIAPIAPRTGAESRMDYALLDNNYVSMSFCSLCRGW